MDILCHQLVSLGHPSNPCAIIETLVSHQKHCPLLYRQALDPCLHHGAHWRLAMTPALVTACQGHAPWTPWYTCLIPVLVHMFHPTSGTHLLSYGTALTNAQLCFGGLYCPPVIPAELCQARVVFRGTSWQVGLTQAQQDWDQPWGLNFTSAEVGPGLDQDWM